MNQIDRIVGGVMGVIGFVILCVSLGWLPALGIVLMLWANNLHRGSS